MRRIRVSEVIEAARKNGYPWGKGFSEKDGYCVLAQAALNLDIPSWEHIVEALADLDLNLDPDRIWKYNDLRAKDYVDAFNYLESYLKPYSNRMIVIRNFQEFGPLDPDTLG